MVNSVKRPPMVSPMAAPTGAPAEKVANAMERMGDGGKACAGIPSWMERISDASMVWSVGVMAVRQAIRGGILLWRCTSDST